MMKIYALTGWSPARFFPPWRAGGSVRLCNTSIVCQCGGCRKCGLFPARAGRPNGMEVGFAVFPALASGISVTDSRLFVTLRTNERVTSIPFCRKSDEGNRKRNHYRKSQELTRPSRDAKRNLAPAMEGLNGNETISQEHCPGDPEVPSIHCARNGIT